MATKLSKYYPIVLNASIRGFQNYSSRLCFFVIIFGIYKNWNRKLLFYSTIVLIFMCEVLVNKLHYSYYYVINMFYYSRKVDNNNSNSIPTSYMIMIIMSFSNPVYIFLQVYMLQDLCLVFLKYILNKNIYNFISRT